MSKDDVERYLEAEVPDIGLVENDPAEFVCLKTDCEERVTVDPSTLVIESDDAVEVIAKVAEEPADLSSPVVKKKVQLYCSTECRNSAYGAYESREEQS